MLKHLLLIIFASLLAAGCGAPAKENPRTQPTCSRSGWTGKSNLGLLSSYAPLDKAACARAIAPFDVSVWLEAPYNSRKVRGRKEVELGCKPITAAADTCDSCGLPGHSASAMLNFDPSVYPDDARVQRAVLAVHSPDNARGLAEAQLRGRLNVGDELQSLGRPREAATRGKSAGGWVFFDISLFAARAINERRNSIQFELSVPCQTQADNLVTVSLLSREAQLIVEYF